MSERGHPPTPSIRTSAIRRVRAGTTAAKAARPERSVSGKPREAARLQGRSTRRGERVRAVVRNARSVANVARVSFSALVSLTQASSGTRARPRFRGSARRHNRRIRRSPTTRPHRRQRKQESAEHRLRADDRQYPGGVRQPARAGVVEPGEVVSIPGVSFEIPGNLCPQRRKCPLFRPGLLPQA